MKRRAASAAVVAVLGLAGCTSSPPSPSSSSTPTTSPSGSSTPSTEAPTPSASPAPTSSISSAAQLVEQVVLTTDDVGDGYQVKLIPGGDQVVGQVTLDYCGFTFTSEAHRVARRQVEVLTTAGDPTGISNEVVAYDTAADAAKAMAEFRNAVKTCPLGVYRNSSVLGEPDMRFDVSKLSTSAALPVADNAIGVATVRAKGQTGQIYSRLVLQLSGTVLDATYLNGDTPLTADDIAGVDGLAGLTGSRMAGGAQV